THVRAFGYDAHPRGPEYRRVPDPRPLQQHRALDGTARNEDLLAGLEVLHAALALGAHSHDPPPIEQQVYDPGARHHRQVAATHGRAKEGARRRRALAVPDARGREADSFDILLVGVGDHLPAVVLGGGE